MNAKIFRLGVSAALIGLAGSGAFAADDRQRFDIGKHEYENKCATCHGLGGKGNGSFAEFLKTAPTDLTVLAKNNGGVFPVDYLYEVIDGRSVVKSHGDREMPIWGSSYAREGRTAADFYFDLPHATEMRVRSYILALIDYLSRIQEE